MASTYLSRTPSSAGNRKTWTISAWVKRGGIFDSTGGVSADSDQVILGASQTNLIYAHLYFTHDQLRFYDIASGTYVFHFKTNAEFRDPAAWYHIVVSCDTTQATESNRLKIYVNGSQVTSWANSVYPAQNADTLINSTNLHTIGRYADNNSGFFNGYMSEYHLIDGTAYAASTFGQTDTTGVWEPIVAPSVTYGTNGFYLKFGNSGAMGTDSSGQSNTYSLANGNVMQVGDTPTNSFPTFNPLGTDNGLGLGSANLRAFTSNSQSYPHIMTNFAVKSGKWYLETLRSANSVTGGMGVFTTETDSSGNPTEKYMYYTTGNKDTNGSQSAYGASWGQGDLISTTYDATNGQVSFYKNGVSQGVAFTLDTSTYWQFGIQSYTSGTQEDIINFGQEGTFIGNKTAGGNSDANGYGNFFYAVPSGFLALCTQNMSSEITIPVDDGSSAFHTQLYTGTGSARTITNDANSGDFQPDWVWVKHRNDSTAHSNNLVDAVRGGTKTLYSNSGGAQETITQGITGFTTDGFTLGTNVAVNNNTINYKAWQWKAGGTAPSNTYAVKVVSDSGNKYRFDDYGTSAITLELQEGGTFTFDQSDSSNSGHPIRFSTTSDGTHGGGSEYTTGVTTNGTPGQAGAYTRITVAASAPTLYYYCSVHSGMGGQANTGSLFGFTNVKGTLQGVVSPNTTAGFSIVTFTGNGGSQTIGHGLSQAPVLSIRKKLTSGDWFVHTNIFDGGMDYLKLNTTGAKSSSSLANFTSTTSGADDNSDQYVAYFFHPVEGFSRISTYTGNGNADGTFVYTGFRPAYLMTRRTSAGSDGWAVFDSARDPVNGMQYYEFINNGSAEGSGTVRLDFLSNGFKWRQSGSSWNGSNEEYIYIAFAENPLVTSTGKPVTAR